jgi:hypothetical protein
VLAAWQPPLPATRIMALVCTYLFLFLPASKPAISPTPRFNSALSQLYMKEEVTRRLKGLEGSGVEANEHIAVHRPGSAICASPGSAMLTV